MSSPLPPGSVVGILGGGQLGRMMAHAAHRLGYKTHIFSPKRGSATQVSSRKTIAHYEDQPALREFAAAVDVVTTEFESVPAETLRFLAGQQVSVFPDASALAICQDRIREKTFLSETVGVPTATWGAARSPSDVSALLERFGVPCILKTARGGYDGKGQTRISPGGDAEAAWAEIAGDRTDVTAILEAVVQFDREASVVIARATDGSVAAFDLVENEHIDHILHRTIAPAPHQDAVGEAARQLATRIVDTLDYVGVMGVEMFLDDAGSIWVNELAPRPHNSGHWTMDATHTSQFEQAIRAVTGHALGSTARLTDAVMTNLLGRDMPAVPDILREPGAKLHLYGKTHIQPARKMGHVTRLSPSGMASRDDRSR